MIIRALCFINPFSSEYNSLEDFKKLNSLQKLFTLIVVGIVSFYSRGIATTPVFRFLVGRLNPSAVIDTEKVKNISAQIISPKPTILYQQPNRYCKSSHHTSKDRLSEELPVVNQVKTIKVSPAQKHYPSSKNEAQAAFQYFLDEVKLDSILTHEEQHEKIQEFKIFTNNLSQEATSHLMSLLIEETRSRIIDMLQNAGLNKSEVDGFLVGYEEAILRLQNMNVEIAREMLFFVAELKIHRQYVYDFGVALGCPEKQLLRHDLCKLNVEQFEGYARYFRGGRRDEDKLAYLAAWEIHQHEEHHHESYSKEGFDFDNFTEERLYNNMLESVADLLASSKQRGGVTLIDWLVNNYPKKHPNPRLLPFFEKALRKAHAFCLDSEKNPDSEYRIFQGLSCWNNDVEKVFNKLKN